MYKVDIENKKLIKLNSTNFTTMALSEPYDIEDWIEKTPQVLGEEYLIIGRQYILPSGRELDLLAIDKGGSLSIIELKRDNSGTEVEWQAIKYASYCSRFLPEYIFEIYASYLETDIEEAQTKIETFIEVELEKLNENQRIVLVSKEFHSDVISAVLWLRDFEVDIECIRLKPYLTPDNQLIISPEKIIPLPEAKDYVVGKQKKEKEVKKSKIRSTFSLEKSTLNESELKTELKATFLKATDQTKRLIKFFKILLSEDKKFKRKEIINQLFHEGIGANEGQTGRYLSNISQYFTKTNNSHLRQLVSFDTGGGFGEMKDNYKIETKYRSLIEEVLSSLNEI